MLEEIVSEAIFAFAIVGLYYSAIWLIKDIFDTKNKEKE